MLWKKISLNKIPFKWKKIKFRKLIKKKIIFKF